MMQAGANLILCGISDTTVAGWVSSFCARRDAENICSEALTLGAFRGLVHTGNEDSWVSTVGQASSASTRFLNV